MSKNKFESIETRHYREREEFLKGLRNLDRRGFMRLSALAAGMVMAKGLITPHSFQLVNMAYGAPVEGPGALPGTKGQAPFAFAYISDTHLYEKKLNDRFVRAVLRAIDDVNRLDPQPDFVLFGGDLAQLGQPGELAMGAQLLKEIKAPVKMMVGEHDWFFDLGEKWRELFGEPTYSFDLKGAHFVTLMSVNEKDFWTPMGLTPMERMKIVAGLDDSRQSRFEVGEAQRAWLKQDLAKHPDSTPIVVFSHSPLYHYYRGWNFWTEDAEPVQDILKRFDSVTVIHGHTHQMLSNRIGNIDFQGLLSTAWPWPYAPEGLPKLTVQMDRPNPFDEQDGLGDGQFKVNPDPDKKGAVMVDQLYNLWNRHPVTVSHRYLKSGGKEDQPLANTLPSY
jgi:3',5'-cyclic AMP phosphodiesterase CpdA